MSRFSGDTPKYSEGPGSIARVPTVSTALKQTNEALSPGNVPIASAAPQPANAAPAAAGLPTASAAPQPASAAPARVATAEAPSAVPKHPRGDRYGDPLWYLGAVQRRGQGARQSDEAWH